MGTIIGLGGWSSYYNYLLGSIFSKIIKDDLLGFGNDSQFFNNLLITNHCFLILFLGYFSDFLFGSLVSFYLFLKEKKTKKKRAELKNGIKKPKKKKQKELELAQNNNNTDDDKKEKGMKHFIENKKDDTKGNNRAVSSNYNKYELIHTDIYENIVDNSWKYIIISSILLITKDILEKLIFQNNDIFDYFFVNILIITLIIKYYYKENIYKHQVLALAIILTISGPCLIACIFNTTNNIIKEGYSSTILDIFNGQYYMIFLLIFISISISLCLCIGILIQKRIMENKFVTPYKLLFYKGIFGLIIMTVIIIVSTNVSCGKITNKSENNQTYIDIDNKNYYNINDINFLTEEKNKVTNDEDNEDNTTKFQFLLCIDSYGEDVYYDNLFSYFKNITKQDYKYIEIFLSIPLYIIFQFITNVTLLLVIKFLSPIHCLMQDSIYNIIHIPIQYISQSFNGNYTEINDYSDWPKIIFKSLDTRILRIISYFVSIIGYFIYLEIIELKFCGLNKNIRKNIRKRAKKDGEIIQDAGSERTESTYSSNSSAEDPEENNKPLLE